MCFIKQSDIDTVGPKQGDFIAGNIKQCRNKWDTVTTNPVVLDWVSNGVKLPFDSTPPSFEIPNRQFSERYTQFVNSELKSLLAQGAVEKVNVKPWCVSPIGVVPKKGGKLRLICDLRNVNDACTPPKFVYENIDSVLDIVEYQDNFVSVDLQNGFHHVLVKEEDRKFLGFSWQGIYYQWRVLPFGLNASPYFFCKILRPVAQYLREKGLKIVIYVDDILLIASTQNIEHDKSILLDCLRELGWFIKLEKCSLVPASRIGFIGYTIDSVGVDGCPILKINSERIRKLRRDLRRLVDTGQCTKRQLARVAGQCVSMSKAILPAKLLLRNIYRLLSKSVTWDSIVKLDHASSQDLKWWIGALESWNGLVLKPHKDAIQMETDASASGWGCCIGQLETSGLWDNSMRNKPSNFRELAAVYLGIKSFSSILQGKAVTVLSDNITTCAYLNHLGGPVQSLTRLAQAVWALVFKLDIDLRAHYLPGKLNVQADGLSREKSMYEWKLHPELFRVIDRTFGPHTIDRFASFQTRQLPRYNSRSFDPETEAVDALSQNNWTQEVNFVNPPFKLIPKVLNVVQSQSAVATIIAPWWPNQTWMSKLKRMAIRPPLRIPNNRRAIQYYGTGAEPLKNRKWQLYAWKISGKDNYTTMDGLCNQRNECSCVGQDLLWAHTIDSYSSLQTFVEQDTSVFRPGIQA